jgi:hypothetical protein
LSWAPAAASSVWRPARGRPGGAPRGRASGTSVRFSRARVRSPSNPPRGRARGRSVLLTDRQSLVRRLDVGLGARGGLQPSVALQRACASHPQCHVRPAAPESVLWAMRARARLARSYSMNKMEVDNDGERGGAGSTTFSTTPATLRCSPALQTANSTLLWWHFRAALSRSRASSTHRPTPPRTEARQ